MNSTSSLTQARKMSSASSLVLLCFLFAAAQTGPIGEEIRGDNIDERGPYVGGDMILNADQLAHGRSGINGNRYRWPKGQVPYVLDNAFPSSERKVVMDAIYEIQNKTCIRFIPRTSQHADYATIVRGAANSGCYSNVGRQGGNQKVNIQPGNPGCVYKGIVAHELIHAIGYYHEQSRTDRDDFVTINYENIQSGMSYNFDKYSSAQVSTHGVGYDYSSIMHYSGTAFSRNGRETITPKDSGVSSSSLGQRNVLSTKDAQKINNMYENCAAVL